MSNTLTNRLREPSTWAGFGAILMSGAQAWATRDPAAIATTLAGLLAIVLPERKQ